MASPDRLLALFFRLPTSISEFSKKMTPLTGEIAIFAGSAPSKKLIFGLQNRIKIYVFSTCFWERYFFKFLYQKCHFWGPTQAQLSVKNLHIFIIFLSGAPKTRWEPQKPPKACPGRLQEPPKASKMSFWTSKTCIFLPQGYRKHKKYQKTSVFATHPESAKITTKSIDSEHFRADPGKICFLDPKI